MEEMLINNFDSYSSKAVQNGAEQGVNLTPIRQNKGQYISDLNMNYI
jgi:hypothetical protein